jgi:hypothetical protein
LQVGEGDAIELVRLQHFTSPAAEPSVSLVVDICATGLPDATTYTKSAFESDAFAASKPPKPKELRTLPQRKAYAFLGQKDPEQVMREAEEEARFKADMEPSRELHEAEKVAGDAVEHKLLMKLLVQPVAEKKAPLKCDHGRLKSQCKDCGTGYCLHGRREGRALQGLRCGLLLARALEEAVQGLRYGLLRPRALEEAVQGLRYGLLLARAPEGSLQGLQCIGNRQQTIDNSQ